MQFTYDTDMFVKTFESEFTWLNGFMRNVMFAVLAIEQLLLTLPVT